MLKNDFFSIWNDLRYFDEERDQSDELYRRIIIRDITNLINHKFYGGKNVCSIFLFYLIFLFKGKPNIKCSICVTLRVQITSTRIGQTKILFPKIRGRERERIKMGKIITVWIEWTNQNVQRVNFILARQNGFSFFFPPLG